MTQEDKDLLFQDLCARLPYGVKVDHFGTVKELLGIMPSSEIVMVGYDINDYEDSVIEDIKPHLRPLSSMTEEEEKQFQDVNLYEFPYTVEGLDWLNAHHFDYRGLIIDGLAIEAPESMYNS